MSKLVSTIANTFKGVGFMNAVGIDVAKGKSTVTIHRPGNEVVLPPRDFLHSKTEIASLIEIIKGLEGETKACMEHTGRYYEPVATWLSDAGIFVSAVNPILVRDFGDDSLRAPKTDKADAKKIARYTLDRWANESSVRVLHGSEDSYEK